MKIYYLVSTDTFQDNCSVTVDLFLEREDALAAMTVRYDEMLESLCMAESDNGGERYCNREQATARIVDEASIYTWHIGEFEQDIQVAVEVQGGLVQNIYANTDIDAQVYDLDLTDIQEEGGLTERELRQAALAEVTSAPGWRRVW